MKEADMDAVKLEGGRRVISRIKALADAGILVMGHIGLTPRALVSLADSKLGDGIPRRKRLIRDALAIQEAGLLYTLRLFHQS